MTNSPRIPLDTTVPHSARVMNYWLGGKDHYPVDRALGEQVEQAFPEIVELMRADRRFIVRSVTHLAREEGVRQFLDIGSGLPAENNTHEVAQAVAPESRVVYVDNDPMVLTHARALLTSTPEGSTHYIDADMLDPETLLARAREHLDFTQPIGLVIMGALGHFPADERTYAVARAYVDALPSGSFLALCDSTDTSRQIVEAAEAWNENAAQPIHLRTPEQVSAFFDGLELLEPGVVSVPFWRPGTARAGAAEEVAQYGGVARKP
ncbi:SAM-dependent methyltransferase [Nocardiopsis sp. CT-R113]|uniref:SAM-dependent methyltransferase n=1 Tax=Nocardiopsis codii TaxID=3065942 RepID=A0ABU7K5N1_9ACTN|nr:SAM-dependent methyltransferase [Nocardiopsis sp. CT-R113]MEE2037553.1 SAM-dependent methyltransferase [Nocardiopsis sp. CT-R113]